MIIGYDGSKLSTEHKTGTEHYAAALLQHLLKIDQVNTYRVYTHQRLDLDYLNVPNVEQRPIELPRLWTQVGLAKEVWANQPDVLFIPAHTMPIIHKSGLKTVVTIHDLGYEYLPQHHQFPQKLYLNRTTEYAASHATRLIAVSQFTKQDLINKLHVPQERIDVVYEGVEPMARPLESDIQAVKNKHNLTSKYLLFVGTIQPRKNLIRLIEAFANLSSQHPDLQLVLAGGKGWLSHEIYQAPAQFKVEDKVKFLGYIDEVDKPALYAGAEATALVSLFEGFGLPVIESMAVGTPVIASSSSSLPEVVGQAGVLVDPENVQDITQGLEKIISQAELREQCVSLGYEQSKKFNWQKAAQKTLAVLEMAAQ